MLLGNAGIVTAMSGLILTFVKPQTSASFALRIVLLVSGLVLLWAVASSHWIDRRLSKFISKALKKYTRLEVQDYAKLLHLAGEYQVTEMQIQKEDWLNDRTLGELNLRDEGIIVLGVSRSDGNYLGAPDGLTRLTVGDTLIMYGRGSVLENLDQRHKGHMGDLQHQKVVAEQKGIVHEEKKVERKHQHENDPKKHD
jgi:K+/H+ antiporter YhaU regulatory subunit KhtT